MAASPAFKPWGAFLKRAEELERESAATGDSDLAVVAFHCRKYVVEKAVKTLEKPAADPFFMCLFSELESKKKSLVGMTPEQRRELCTVHAHSVFAKGVKQKEAEEASTGRASKNTAAIFYKAGTLLDILDQFDIPPDEAVVEKRRYAKHIAAEILKTASSDAPLPPPTMVRAAAPPSAPPAAIPTSVASLAAAPSSTSSPSSAGSVGGVVVGIARPSAPPAAAAFEPQLVPAHMASSLAQAPQRASSDGASMIGFAEGTALANECIELIEAGDWERARDAIDACLLVRCQNAKVRDAAELCQFAIAALRSTHGDHSSRATKAGKFAADAKRRLASS